MLAFGLNLCKNGSRAASTQAWCHVYQPSVRAVSSSVHGAHCILASYTGGISGLANSEGDGDSHMTYNATFGSSKHSNTSSIARSATHRIYFTGSVTHCLEPLEECLLGIWVLCCSKLLSLRNYGLSFLVVENAVTIFQ